MTPTEFDPETWADERISEWVLYLRAATHLGSWGAAHLEALETESRNRRIII